MNWNKWIRQSHRWLSVVFTVAVIINGVTVVQGKYNNRLGLSAVAILALLLLSGLYLFVLPYAGKWRRTTHRLNGQPSSRQVGRVGGPQGRSRWRVPYLCNTVSSQPERRDMLYATEGYPPLVPTKRRPTVERF